ncbi:hypothetical protein [Ralstonia syzygii]|uniref:hypothetical protein n=1 Tax=Ralstonia syzygii TaxID=28097 RepID=UPI0036F1FF30
MFQATAAQKANANMYASFLPQDRINNFYARNGLVQPSSAAVTAANQRTQSISNAVGGATIAAPVATSLLIGAPVATATGGVFGLATIGGVVGGGMDAAGQYAQAGTIRPVQSIFATATGAVTGPIGAQVGFVNNILLGGVGGAVNTAFNNVYYGENNNVGYAAAVGGLAGGQDISLAGLSLRG